MAAGKVNHAWPVQYGEKWCGKRENPKKIMVFGKMFIGFSTGQKVDGDKLFGFSTAISTPCGKMGVGKRKVWKTQLAIWMEEKRFIFPFSQDQPLNSLMIVLIS